MWHRLGGTDVVAGSADKSIVDVHDLAPPRGVSLLCLDGLSQALIPGQDPSYRTEKLILHATAGVIAGAVVTAVHPAPLLQTRWIRIAAGMGLTVGLGLALAALRGRCGGGAEEERLLRARLAFWTGIAFGVAYAVGRVCMRFLM